MRPTAPSRPAPTGVRLESGDRRSAYESTANLGGWTRHPGA